MLPVGSIQNITNGRFSDRIFFSKRPIGTSPGGVSLSNVEHVFVGEFGTIMVHPGVHSVFNSSVSDIFGNRSEPQMAGVYTGSNVTSMANQFPFRDGPSKQKKRHTMSPGTLATQPKVTIPGVVNVGGPNPTRLCLSDLLHESFFHIVHGCDLSQHGRER